MATFFGFLFFSPVLAMFFGFVAWFAPAMVFPDQVARRRPRAFGYLVTGFSIIAVLSIYLLLSPAGGHDAAPILGTACSFGIILLIRQRTRGLGGGRTWNWPWSRHDDDDLGDVDDFDDTHPDAWTSDAYQPGGPGDRGWDGRPDPRRPDLRRPDLRRPDLGRPDPGRPDARRPVDPADPRWPRPTARPPDDALPDTDPL